MEWQVLYVLGLSVATLVLLISGRVRFDALGILLMVALVAAGVVPYKEAVAGFGNKAILTIAGLYIVGDGLTRTGALEFLARTLLKVSLGRTRRMILLTGIVAAVASSFLNDTAVVVVLLPILVEIARTTGASVARLLMPLSFCALLGGMNTLIGTSTNLLVSGVAEEWGQRPIRMFEMTPLASVLTATGLVYVTLFARKLLPERKSLTVLMGERGHRQYVTEVVIGPTSQLIGQAYRNVFDKVRADLVFYVRDEELVFGPFDEHVVRKGDVVMLRGTADAIADLQRELGLRYAAGTRSAEKELSFFEVAIAPHSMLAGRRAHELELWRDFGAVTVAILRAGQHIRERVSSMHLRAGDLLLVLGDEEAEARLGASDDFYVLTGHEPIVRLRAKAATALAIAGGVVAFLAASSLLDLEFLPIPFVALLGALMMIATGCVTPRRVYHTIDWPVLLFIVGTLALGVAMERTGAADLVATGILAVGAGWGETAIISGFVLLCIVLNSLVAHAAVAVLLTPIAITTAEAYCVSQGITLGDPHAEAFVRGCIMAIAFGGSLCFATPTGHQVNMMVMGPGGYVYKDFLRFGLPLSLLAWVILSVGIPILVGL